MNRRHASTPRLSSLRAALKAAQPDDDVTLPVLTEIWGSSKGQFVKIRDQCMNFPPHKTGPHGVLIYPARAALEALIAFDTKDDVAAEALARRQTALLGVARKAGSRKGRATESFIPIDQLAKAARLAAEIEQRERDQGEFIAKIDVERVIGNVFSIISGRLSSLETMVDPSSSLPLPQRHLINKAGRDVLLQVNAEVKDMLAGNVRRKSPRARKTPGRAR